MEVPEVKRKRAYSPRAQALGVSRPYKRPYKEKKGPVPELKWFDNLLVDQVPISSTGNIHDSINLIPQGEEQSERIGRKVTIKSIEWNFGISRVAVIDATAPVSRDAVRLILYIDKQCNGAAAPILEILQTAFFRSYPKIANEKRFLFLHDETIDLGYDLLASDASNAFSSPAVQLNFKISKKVDFDIEFDDAEVGIEQVMSNNIGVLSITSGGQASLLSYTRIRYTDC